MHENLFFNISARPAHALAAMHLVLRVQEGWQLNVAHATLESI